MKPIIKPLILAAALSWPTIVIGAEEKCPTHEEIAALAKQVTTEYGVEDARIVILTGDKANKVAKFMHDDPAYHQGDFDILKASSFDFILFPEIIGNPGVVDRPPVALLGGRTPEVQRRGQAAALAQKLLVGVQGYAEEIGRHPLVVVVHGKKSLI
jgi:hypothetical protein